MNISKRLDVIRRNQINKQVEIIKSLSDAELEELLGKDKTFSKWLETLSDDQLDILIYQKKGYRELMNKYENHRKQITTTGRTEPDKHGLL